MVLDANHNVVTRILRMVLDANHNVVMRILHMVLIGRNTRNYAPEAHCYTNRL